MHHPSPSHSAFSRTQSLYAKSPEALVRMAEQLCDAIDDIESMVENDQITEHVARRFSVQLVRPRPPLFA